MVRKRIFIIKIFDAEHIKFIGYVQKIKKLKLGIVYSITHTEENAQKWAQKKSVENKIEFLNVKKLHPMYLWKPAHIFEIREITDIKTLRFLKIKKIGK